VRAVLNAVRGGNGVLVGYDVGNVVHNGVWRSAVGGGVEVCRSWRMCQSATRQRGEQKRRLGLRRVTVIGRPQCVQLVIAGSRWWC
jgi:hypothetical protein